MVKGEQTEGKGDEIGDIASLISRWNLQIR